MWLTSEGSLINLPLFGSGKWHSVRLQLQNSLRSLSAHVVDSVLISQPITSFYCIVSVPSPIVLMHVTKGRIDTSLSGHSVRSCWEKLWDTSRFKPLLYKTESGSQSSPTGTYDYSVKCMINDSIFFKECILKLFFKLPQHPCSSVD